MYCPHCNEVLSDNATVCPFCGTSVKKQKTEFSAPKKPMRWYKFLIYVSLPVSLLGYAYHIWLCVQFGKLWLIPAPVLLAALNVNVLISLVKRRRRGPTALVILCVLNTILFIASSRIFYGSNGGYDLIATSVYGGLTAFFNYLYFEKRSYYFEK